MKSSNIGGQAVMEGVMMMNKDRYSVAVRRPDGEIEVKVEQHKPLTKHKGLLKVPILRGVFSFADSMIVGMSSLMYSASFYEDEEEEKKKPATKEEEEQQKAKKEKTDRLMMYGTVTFSVVIAVVLFLMVPYFLSELLHKAGAGTTLTAVAEAFARVALFLGYLAAISRMEDIQRVFMYHGAEHQLRRARSGTERGKRLKEFPGAQALRNELSYVRHRHQHHLFHVHPGRFPGAENCDPPASHSGDRGRFV